MKKSFNYCLLLPLFLVLILVGGGNEAVAQLKLPQASPKARIMQTIGLTEVTVEYNAPGVKDREVWGKLVPYNQIWRTGANEATTIHFNHDIWINTEKVPAGKYSLYTLPVNENIWYVVLNKDTTLWGAEGYDEALDQLRVRITTSPAEFHERLVFSFSNLTDNSANLNLNWERLRISIPIQTEVEQLAMEGIREALEKAAEDDWLIYAQAANYLIEKDTEHLLALEWIDKSLELKENFYNNWVKAKLMAQKNEYIEATNYSKKALKLGKSEGDSFKTFANQIEKSMEQWKVKRYGSKASSLE
jgi:tetratricopeptide (TPR) repeat protein